MHGGDIYRNKVKYDFSVSINPLFPLPQWEKELFSDAEQMSAYPDIKCEALRKRLSELFSIDIQNILMGNGASELFMAIVHALKPKGAYIPMPSFYGYKWVCNSERVTINTKGADNDTQIVFIANPGNPTGRYFPRDELLALVKECKKRNIIVVLDECFMELSDDPRYHTLTAKLKEYPNLIIVRAFTKSFSVPGIRLGYLLCEDKGLVKKIAKHLPEWNVSGPAQIVGIKALDHIKELEASREYIKAERKYLRQRLLKIGIKAEESDCNFMLIQGLPNLYEDLLSYGILIRKCDDYEGLNKGYYRIAVKKREANNYLIASLEKIQRKSIK